VTQFPPTFDNQAKLRDDLLATPQQLSDLFLLLGIVLGPGEYVKATFDVA
jgi:hypothetical protein